MGLDMYAYALERRPSKAVDFEDELKDIKSERLFYWRKHPNLHGWMEELYRNKSGQGEPGFDGPNTFNCVPLLLESEDIDRLEKVVLEDKLPRTSGFFFGQSTVGNRANDLKFIKLARAAIADGKSVYYTSWW